MYQYYKMYIYFKGIISILNLYSNYICGYYIERYYIDTHMYICVCIYTYVCVFVCGTNRSSLP